MRERFDSLKSHFLRLKTKRELLERQLEEERKRKEELEKRLNSFIKARSVVQEVARQTQSKLEFRLSSLVSTALRSVFPNPYVFEVRFVTKRNKSECEFFFVKGGERMRPLDSSGGGALDVASFALRLVFWTLRKTRPVLILDETFRFVSVDLQHKCSQMLKALSEELDVQIILISHLPEIIQSADKVFRVENKGGVSYLEEV